MFQKSGLFTNLSLAAVHTNDLQDGQIQLQEMALKLFERIQEQHIEQSDQERLKPPVLYTNSLSLLTALMS